MKNFILDRKISKFSFMRMCSTTSHYAYESETVLCRVYVYRGVFANHLSIT